MGVIWRCMLCILEETVLPDSYTPQGNITTIHFLASWWQMHWVRPKALAVCPLSLTAFCPLGLCNCLVKSYSEKRWLLREVREMRSDKEREGQVHFCLQEDVVSPVGWNTRTASQTFSPRCKRLLYLLVQSSYLWYCWVAVYSYIFYWIIHIKRCHLLVLVLCSVPSAVI